MRRRLTSVSLVFVAGLAMSCIAPPPAATVGQTDQGDFPDSVADGGDLRVFRDAAVVTDGPAGVPDLPSPPDVAAPDQPTDISAADSPSDRDLPIPCAASLPKPLVHWSMDVSVNGEVPNTGSIAGLGLSVVGATFVNSQFASALALDGTLNVKPSAPHHAALQLASGAFSVWFRADASVVVLGGLGGLLTKEAAGTNSDGQLSLELRDGQVRFRLERASESVFLFAPVQPDQWHHALASWAPGRSELWLDGTLIDSVDAGWTIATNTEPLAVGFSTGDSADGSVDPSSEPFFGAIDEVSIWDVALDAQQVPKLIECAPNY